MAKSEHIYHGDPRHHATDISALKARVAELEAEVKDRDRQIQALKDAESRTYWGTGW